MMKFKPARMRHRVTFQEKQRTQNAEGLEEFEWVDVATNLRADVIALSGKERLVSAQTAANYTARVTIYKNSRINESMRMVFKDRFYNIIDILPDETDRVYYNLMVEKYG